MKPLIGITGTRHLIETQSSAPPLLSLVSADDYAQGVEAAGGLPVIIPYAEQAQTLVELVSRLDGLLLAGGEDIDPALFGSEPLFGLGNVVPERDALEIALIKAMLEAGKPILGICRGMQILNVALGGTLYQDMPREWRGRIQHRQRARRDHLSHGLKVREGSKLHACFGATVLRCNSFHHQAVKGLGTGLIGSVWDAEGLIEGMEHKEYPFVVAVQWHPENLWRQSEAHLGLFRGLVEAAASTIVGTNL